MENLELKAYVKSRGVFLYEVARELGISEYTFCKRLRKRLTQEEALEIKKIVDEIHRTK